MPADSPFPVPDDSAFITWAMQNKQGIQDAMRFLNRLHALQFQITGTNTAQPYCLVDSDANTILTLAIKFASPVQPAAGGSVIDVQCRAQLAALLTALGLVGING